MSMKSPHIDLADMLAEIDGEMADERARAHVAACADCRAETEGWAAVAGGISFLAASIRVPAAAIPDAAPSAWRRRRRPGWRALIAAACAAAAVAGVLVFVLPGHSRLTRPLHTPWVAAQPLPQHTVAGTRAAGGAWRLASYLVTGWQRKTEAVSGVWLTCPAAGMCYVIGDSTTSSSGVPDLNTLYVSTSGGIGWSTLPVPSGLSFTTPLSCATATDCATGGLYLGQAVFADTSDGGHSWTIDPLPATARGVIFQLSCPTSSTCSGLLATEIAPGPGWLPGWFYYGGVTFLRTTDAGRTFVISKFPAGQVMQALSCVTASDCVAIGVSSADVGLNKLPKRGGFVEITADGGATWTPGRLPPGYGPGDAPQLTCPDAEHCFATGTTNLSNDNVIAASGDGGRTWTLLPLPRDVPGPDLSNVSCPTDSTCYLTGSDNRGVDGSAMLLTTSDGGVSWRPAKVPAGWWVNDFPEIGPIQCPHVDMCVALGATFQGDSSTPIFTLGNAP
jgi:hypothetical protein